MKPIDLTPEEARIRRAGAMRTGPLPFVIVGGLVALLVGVALLVTTSNEISDTKAEIADKEARKSTLSLRAAQLEPYVQFHEMKERRVATVAELAEGRFDWVRTINQLARITPEDVWLLELRAAAAPGAAPGGGGGSSVAGPSLEMIGCASGQDAVAGFVAAIRRIDGVTRVGLKKSALPTKEGGSGGDKGCPPDKRIARFEVVVAFDEAPPSPNYGDGATATATTATAAPEAEGAAATQEGEAGTGEAEGEEGEAASG